MAVTAATSDADRDRLVAEICALAHRAGAEILKYYRGEYEVREKADASPVTVADEAAEAIILPALRALTPAIPVVAEEEMAAGKRVDVGGGPFWLVDPLDGTKEFIAGRDEFTVNIALVEAARPVLGVIHLPVSGVLYAAAGPGTASRSLLHTVTRVLNLVGRDDFAVPDARPLDYKDLQLGFEINTSGLTLLGHCENVEPGTIMTDTHGSLLRQPQRQPIPVVRLIRALVPNQDVLVPATQQTESLLRVLPLPPLAAVQE